MRLLFDDTQLGRNSQQDFERQFVQLFFYLPACCSFGETCVLGCLVFRVRIGSDVLVDQVVMCFVLSDRQRLLQDISAGLTSVHTLLVSFFASEGAYPTIIVLKCNK